MALQTNNLTCVLPGRHDGQERAVGGSHEGIQRQRAHEASGQGGNGGKQPAHASCLSLFTAAVTPG